MKIKNKILPFILTAAVIGIASCKKDDKCVGGSGGNVTVKATLMHHTVHIVSLPSYRDTIYVRYNAQDYPSNGLAGFNQTFIGDAGKDFVLITGLKCGDYYFYAVGGDTVWVAGDTTHVKGGYPFSTSNTSGETDINMAVNE